MNESIQELHQAIAVVRSVQRKQISALFMLFEKNIIRLFEQRFKTTVENVIYLEDEEYPSTFADVYFHSLTVEKYGEEEEEFCKQYVEELNSLFEFGDYLIAKGVEL